MNIDDWFEWPTKSTDPGVNFVVLIFLTMLVIVLAVMGAFVAIPIVIMLAIAKGVHWYVNRPVPTDQLALQTEQRAVTANFPSSDDFLKAHIARLFDGFSDRLPAYNLYLMMVRVAAHLYEREDLHNPLPPLPPANTIEEGRYRDQLLLRMRKSADAPKTLEVFNNALSTSFLRLIDGLPPLALTTREQFAETDKQPSFATFPLTDLLPDPGRAVMQVMTPFFSDEIDQLGLFNNLRNQLDRNIHSASGIEYPAPAHKLVLPEAHKGTAREIVSAYLHDTPLEALFDAPIPFSFTDDKRFEHMHVVGGSGHGKTQLLQHLILNDVQRPVPPTLIVIDSQGEMLKKIQALGLFAPNQPLSDKLIIIDPEDVEHPPALNMFDVRAGRHSAYSRAEKEQIEASTIEMFNYVFGALAAELTSKQNTTFAFVTRLMLSIPGATIHTLRDLFEDAAQTIEQSAFREHILRLDPTSQAYFQNQFFTRTYSQTKQQIARRLYGVLQVPAFDRMFASKENRFDMFEAMQSGSIVLINTSKALLKSDASALFGRAMIARVIAAAFERVALSRDQRNPAFLIVDEAAEYFDDNLETLLAQARKYNVGVLFAHQHLDQLSPSLRAAVAANTSIKLAGGISDRDARTLAADMRTSPDFIADMRKHRRSTEFACFVRNITSNAVRLEIPFGSLEGSATMSPSEHAQLIAENRRRYAVRPDEPRPAATGPDTPAEAATANVAPPESADDWRS